MNRSSDGSDGGHSFLNLSRFGMCDGAMDLLNECAYTCSMSRRSPQLLLYHDMHVHAPTLHTTCHLAAPYSV